jgi:hypothetical protein
MLLARAAKNSDPRKKLFVSCIFTNKSLHFSNSPSTLATLFELSHIVFEIHQNERPTQPKTHPEDCDYPDT